MIAQRKVNMIEERSNKCETEVGDVGKDWVFIDSNMIQTLKLDIIV